MPLKLEQPSRVFEKVQPEGCVASIYMFQSDIIKGGLTAQEV